jgi:hypothetical protein
MAQPTPSTRPPHWTGLIIPALLYGLVSRLLFGLDGANDVFSTLSFGFLGLVPVGIGALTAFIGQYGKEKPSFGQALIEPVMPSGVFLLAAMLFNIEVAICLLMAAPLYFVLPLIGGALMYVVLLLVPRSSHPLSYSTLALLLIAPYLVGAAEGTNDAPTSLRTVEASVIIDADADAVWAQITSVPTIREDEHSLSLFQLIGVPRPQQASLPRVEIGAVRASSWEGGVAFVETITAFAPHQHLTFTMALDPAAEVPAPFDQIGGDYFDVVEGGYRLEPLDDGQVRLHLWSTHRLTTTINAYGGLWTDLIMWDLQRYILNIVKQRAETA